jgi:hypothetical protein
MGNPEGKDQYEDVKDERIILKYVLERLDGVVSTKLIWLKIRTDGGLL